MGEDRERTPGVKNAVIHGLATAAAAFAGAAAVGASETAGAPAAGGSASSTAFEPLA